MSIHDNFHTDMIINPKRMSQASAKGLNMYKELHDMADDIAAYYKPVTSEDKDEFLSHLKRAIKTALKEYRDRSIGDRQIM